MRARMESTTDFLLVHRARAGDEEACERLVRKYYPSIYQYCLLHIYDTYEAEDLTQEVFARAFASLDRYREYGKVKNYLYTIVGNVVKNYYKKKKDIPLEELPEVETENREEMVGIRLDIEQAVRKLPEELREECRKRIPGNMRKVLNQFDREIDRDCEREETTEIVFILDRSGSMAGLERDTVGGFNSMIEKQKKEKGSVLVSTVLFDNTAEVLHDRVDLEKIRPLTEKEYFVGGCTALLDAVGGAIHHIGNVHKYARMEDVPERTLFVIITDGEENASRYYSAKKVKGMIERQKSRYGWEFLFLGANIDAVQTAGRFGISEDRAVNYNCDSRGTMLNYQVIGEAISVFRNDARIDESWKRQIDEDYKKRRSDWE